LHEKSPITRQTLPIPGMKATGKSTHLAEGQGRAKSMIERSFHDIEMGKIHTGHTVSITVFGAFMEVLTGTSRFQSPSRPFAPSGALS